MVPDVINKGVEVREEFRAGCAFSTEHDLFGPIDCYLTQAVNFEKFIDVVLVNLATEKQNNVVRIENQIHFTLTQPRSLRLLHLK